ncbi:MAG: response regulator [Chromatiaceae bacterium]|nr:response regulator [Gammaproteobacteria bacterium]MCB1861186.1 response regulator [Gammaproteobacteria bacterium]MCB1872284.1 response regulator [Gammaproteobacteria bacterium]MCP5428224.1 response regulator [Chromatiaceae bacterium]MCP5448744.1 response regulator [Chromatiaceae bacterium]
MSTVLILDDQSISRMILEELIRSIDGDINVQSFSDPVKALEWAKKNRHDLIITDFKMPVMDGVEFTQWIRQIPTCMDVPIVIITCVDDKSVRYRALEAGATDFLSKPIDHHECRARCKNLLQLRQQQQIIKDRARWLEQEVYTKTHELQQREKETLLRLAKAGEYRDEETGNHVVRMAEYAFLIAQELGLEDDTCNVIRHAAPMHDIGKIGVPDQILLKRGKLTRQEWNSMQVHTRIGYEILRDSPSCFLKSGAVIALGHHERFDGKGYPNGLLGDKTPIEARVAAVADVFDALMSERPYKAAWTMERTLDYMREQRARHFDPDCIDAFFTKLDNIMTIRHQFADRVESVSN